MRSSKTDVLDLPPLVAKGYRWVLSLDLQKRRTFVAENICKRLREKFGSSADGIYLALKRRKLLIPAPKKILHSKTKKFTIVRREFRIGDDPLTLLAKRRTSFRTQKLFLSPWLSLGYEFLLSLDPSGRAKYIVAEGISLPLGQRFGAIRGRNMLFGLKKRGLVRSQGRVRGTICRFVILRRPYGVINGRASDRLIKQLQRSRRP